MESAENPAIELHILYISPLKALAELNQLPLHFRHIARPGGAAEISGQYHPRARLNLGPKVVSRPAMLYDSDRIMLPAYGAYTGGQRRDAGGLGRLLRADAVAVLTGPTPTAIPIRKTRSPGH